METDTSLAAALASVLDCLLFEILNISLVAQRLKSSSHATVFPLEWESKLCLSKEEHKLGMMAYAFHPGT